ncbi:MAG: polysulfide reductase NrfD [SAR324 cluster bacterium]|nr:polysulfide reductase NrfD [SAR324 cluster bacterium]
MIEKAWSGNRNYWLWILFLLVLISIGIYCYSLQFEYGLGITGMSNDVSWGVYIAQFTFFVGVAASAVMLVIPYYLHDYKAFGKIVVLGEFLAVSAVLMCLLFILADMGMPMRVLYVIIHPTPNSMLFWDMLVLNGYLVLNMTCGWVALDAEKKRTAPPKWIKPLIYLSIPWAVSIHTVTAFLYAGLPSRHLWLTAILAPRFLASAFASGPALLIILILLLKKLVQFEIANEAIQKLATIVLYASIINFFFLGLEFFTAFYSNIPGHMHGLVYLYAGLQGQHALIIWMWTSLVLGLGAIVLLLIPDLKREENILLISSVAIFFSLWIDKGIGMVLGGFVPTPLETVTEYSPSAVEIFITLGIWAVGILTLTLLYKIALSVQKEAAA